MKLYKPTINILIIIILILTASLRLYRIREYQTFLGDEGRDVLVVKRMIVDKKFTLLGPITSVGSMYMGPVYYYFMAPFLLMWNFDPVGPAIMVVIFSIATVFLIYKTLYDFYNPLSAFLAAFFYAISPLTIIYGKSSWNPNIVPFFAILLFYSFLKIIINKNHKYILLAGISLGILIQLHYVTYIFFPILLAIFMIYWKKIGLKNLISFIIFFLIGYSPFLLFELRHQFVNTKAVINFLRENQNQTDLLSFITGYLSSFTDTFVRIFWRLFVIISAELTKLIIIICFLTLFKLYKKHNNYKKEVIKLITIWLLVGVFTVGFYRGVVYDYYFGSLYPVVFLIIGLVLSYFYNLNKKTKILLFFIVYTFMFFNFQASPFKIEPNNMIKNTQEISKFIYEKTENKPYNFALIATHNSDHAYRYFLEIIGKPPVIIENEVVDPFRNTVTDQLFIVCEEKICKPLGHPLWEIAGYGKAEIENEWQVSTVKIFKLIKYKNI
jgi:4-amino-4-deoxy-L-arabinose transferase-like glycosyltransferase